MIRIIKLTLHLSLAVTATLASAEQKMPSHELLSQRVKAAGSLPQAQQGSMREGKQLVAQCVMCHGPDGNKSSPQLGFHIPNLAQQQPLYLLNQLSRFADKHRKQPTMGRISTRLTDQQRVTLALFFSAQPLKPVNGFAANADRHQGKRIFQKLCFHCHGKEAAGQAAIPRLHGQNRDYLAAQLVRFRDKRASRSHPPMNAITNKLTDREITALATYLATLKPESDTYRTGKEN